MELVVSYRKSSDKVDLLIGMECTELMNVDEIVDIIQISFETKFEKLFKYRLI